MQQDRAVLVVADDHAGRRASGRPQARAAPFDPGSRWECRWCAAGDDRPRERAVIELANGLTGDPAAEQ
jgi:hypothetical protein